MKKKGIVFFIVGLLAIGVLSGFVYGDEEKTLANNIISNEKVEENLQSKDQKSNYKDMLKIMRKNGYKDVAKALEKKNYEVVDDFMNNLTDEDYEKMTQIMKESGYEHMASMMETMDKDQMIEMHNSMGGAEACHGNDENTSSMMNSF
ncbi:hypothetical protein GOQ27_07210 [Clostridium sp. D2Q-11]|uniref:Uncharacterized protein n=1 Tax=Anaeromonas frigoriresistens TaxID=2683708 RepID=A0A942UXN9_9FIRM|nr:hypothetical protein [Anaeromonas frigoriresistens]MBS4538246.1 hypothetical protein [Anaeromonas frigoriresistens]